MQVSDRPLAISKELSANDTGVTGGHQAGILVPKDPRVLRFFPELDTTRLNPRHHLIFHDDDGLRWELTFVFYNNRQFGGTRNEYRLTRLTHYIRQNGLKPGDRLLLRREIETATLHMSYTRSSRLQWADSGALRLGSSWMEVSI